MQRLRNRQPRRCASPQNPPAVPAIASGAEAIRVARELAALDPGLVIPYQQAFEALPPNHGQI